ncbi:MAG: hypothetical protein Q9220_005729 [cf. Caloplaca sp. 1 TL-2023]
MWLATERMSARTIRQFAEGALSDKLSFDSHGATVANREVMRVGALGDVGNAANQGSEPQHRPHASESDRSKPRDIPGPYERIQAAGLLGSHFGVPGIPGSYDYVIVGGGTAGLTLASRLAANTSITVAVIEAGGLYELDNGNFSQIPADASYWVDGSAQARNPLVDWYQFTEPQPVYKSTLAKKILFDSSKQAIGVQVNSGGFEYQIKAYKEVIVSAGVFRSPQLLMVSGIGPQATLKEQGITVISDRAGVGQNMFVGDMIAHEGHE